MWRVEVGGGIMVDPCEDTPPPPNTIFHMANCGTRTTPKEENCYLATTLKYDQALSPLNVFSMTHCTCDEDPSCLLDGF